MSDCKRRWVFVCAVSIGSATVGCSRGHAPSEAQSQPLTPSSVSSADVAAPVIAPSLSATRSARLDDERWKRAMGEDLADKQALAEALGATELLEALEDGGDIATTALAALPYADDADLALGPLAKRALSASGGEQIVVLTSLLGIAGRPARSREFADPDGAAEAGAALLTIATNTTIAREQRVLAISAARALAEKKIVDPAKIPTDLDPQ